MKKIFTLLLAMGSLTAVFAQSGRYNNSSKNYGNGSVYQSNNYGRNSSYTNNTGYYSNQGHDSYSGQQNWNRNDQRYDNHDGYNDRDRRDNRRVDSYRDDRYNGYDRNHRTVIVQPQRRSTLGAVAGGMIIGGILGAILSH